MSGILDFIENGITLANDTAFTIENIDRAVNQLDDTVRDVSRLVDSVSNVVDRRQPNKERPRIQASDPTEVIDSQSNTAPASASSSNNVTTDGSAGSNINIKTFPADRPRFYMTFAFEEYRRPSQFTGLESTGLTDYIALPIPSNLKDISNLNYSQNPGSFVVDALTRSWQSIANANGEGGITGAINQLMSPETLVQAGELATGLAIRTGIDVARDTLGLVGSESLVDAGLQLMGLADNPFSTVGFGGPSFKQHEFTWTLAARNRAETETIKAICDTFKKVAHPEILSATAGGFYKYPHIVWPKFEPTTLRSYLYTFKPCVITQVGIDFAPNNRPGFYKEVHAPLEVNLSISLLEIEIWRNGTGRSITDYELPTIEGGDFNSIQSPPVRNLGSV